MKNLDPITLVVATDNFYAILLSALLKSIEINHKTEEKIHVYVINDGI
jgi:lipopolysaccharide biosynthesis glycosyltransferase